MFRFSKGIFLMFLTLLLSTAFAFGQEVFVVDDDGNPATTYPTIQAAIATASTFPGGPHEIMVMEGTYSGHSLAITGASNIYTIYGDPSADKADIVFQAPAASYQAVDFLDLSGTTGFILKNFTVLDYKTALKGTGIDDIEVTDIVFGNNGVDGYAVPADEDGGAVIFYDCDNGLFDNLYAYDGERGLRLRGTPDYSDGNMISNSVFENNEQYGIGIGWYGGSNNTITGNVVTGSEDFGIQIRGTGANNVISDNVVGDCYWEGITVSGTTNNSITGNTVYGCAFEPINPSGGNDHTGISYAGIDIEGAATSATITGNLCYENGNGTTGFGINVDGFYCDISDNCFWGHPGTQAVDNIGGNYWHANYYSDLAAGATSYSLGSATDYSPKMRMNLPETPATTIEVWDNFTVDFNFYHPDVCDTTNEVGLALYEFTVTWDPAKLDYVGGDNYEFLGASGDALYVISGNPAMGNLTFSGTNFDTPNPLEGALAWIEFQAIGTGAATVTVNSTYRDVNNADMAVGSTPLNLTIQDTEAPSVTVTANNPIGDDTYSDGYGNVQLFVEGDVTDNYCLASVWYRFDDAGSWTMIKAVSGTADTYGGLPTDYYLDITGLGEGAHNVNVIALDCAGNRDSVYYNFNIDRTGPDIANLALADSDGCADAGYTSSDVVDVSWDNPDGSAVEHEFYYGSAPGWQGALAYANPTTYTLDGTEGTHQLWVRQYDVYGNQGAQIGPVAIVLDKTAPTPSTDFALAGGAAKTATTSITGDISLFGPDSPYFMTSEDAGDLVCGNAGWQAPPTHPFAVELSTGDGVKTVYFATKDLAGNVSVIQSDDIELDTTPPELTSFTVVDANGDECSDSWTVNVIVEYADADAAKALFSMTSGSYSMDWTLSGTSPDTFSYTISGGTCNDLNTVYAILEDDIGNQSTVELSDDIFVDCAVPTITSVLVTDPDYDGSLYPSINWTNDTDLDFEVAGLTPDVVELQISTTGAFAGEEVAVAVSSPGDPYNFTFSHTGASDCDMVTFYVRALDCAGRLSPVANDAITFDFTAPEITAFDVTSANPTNVLSADFAQTFTDGCNSWRMQIFEDGYEGSGTGWITDAATYAGLALQDIGDGTRTIHLQILDPAGNIASASTTVDVDQTVPTGSFVIQQTGNPLAMPGYTSSLTNNELVSITADADVVSMRLRDNDNVSIVGWTPLVSSYSPVTLGSNLGCGTYEIEIRFEDAAGNLSAWIPATIDFLDGTCPPLAPSWATGVPGGSIELEWENVTGAQYYYLKYNFTGQYPEFIDGVPPHPGGLSGDTLEGIFLAMTDANAMVADMPHADIYSVSIWTIDMAGNISAMPNTDVVETDYMLGDLDLDGEIEFVDDFGLFATAYSLTDADAGWLPEGDIGPTSDASGTGYPIPDQVINVEDLAIMGMNYTTFAKNNSLNDYNSGYKVNPEPRSLIATIDQISETEYNISVQADQYSDIMLYHFVFNTEQPVEVLSSEKGEAFTNTNESWFYRDTKASGIDVTGIIVGEDAFTSGELVSIVVSSDQPLTSLEDLELTMRDRYNNDIPVEFEVVAKLEVLPTEFALSQNYPNPFNPTTTIELSLPQASEYSLYIFNVTGQVVDRMEGNAEAGVVTINWDASKYSSGVYFYRVEAGNFSATKKMVLLK